MIDKRIKVIRYLTNQAVEYDQIFLHPKPEDNLVSLYNGGFGDEFRKIYKIKDKHQDLLTGNLTIWVKEF